MAQDFNRVFGSTGTSDTFSDADYNEGLEAIVGSVPPSKGQHNGIWNEHDLKSQEIHQEGLTTYSVATNYPIGGISKGSDAILYQSAVANGPLTSVVDPVGDATGVWAVYGAASRLAVGTDAYTLSGVSIADGAISIVRFENANTGVATLNGKAIVNRAGLPMLAGDLNAASSNQLRYDLANERFVAESVKVHCYISRNTPQNLSNDIFVAVNLNNTEYDSAGAFDDGETPNTVVVPAGFTRARFRISCDFAPSEVGSRQLRLYINGIVDLLNTMSVQASASNRTSNLSLTTGWLYPAPSDLFTVRVLQGSGGNLNLDSATIYAEFE